MAGLRHSAPPIYTNHHGTTIYNYNCMRAYLYALSHV